MKKLALIYPFLLLIFSGISYGQSDFKKGFLIDHHGDTIKGYIKFRLNYQNYESCLFKDENGKKTEYTSDQIKGYGFYGDKFYSSEIIEGSFAEVLVMGKLSLFKLKQKYYVQSDTSLYVLESAKEKVIKNGIEVLMETKKWRGRLSYLTRDCDKISKNEMGKVKFMEKHLTGLIVKYNACMGEEFSDIKSDKHWSKIDVGIDLGMAMTNIQFKQTVGPLFDLITPYNSIDPSIGLQFNFTSPRLSDKFGFQSGIYFVKASFLSSVSSNRFFQQKHDIKVDLTSLSFPLSLKYSISGKKFGFNIIAGMINNVNISHESDIKSKRIEENSEVEFENAVNQVFIITNSYQIGVGGGFELTKRIKGLETGIAIRHYQMSPIIDLETVFLANTNRTSISFFVKLR